MFADTRSSELQVKRGVTEFVNQAGKDGETPLCAAAKAGHLEIVIFLVDAGADVNGLSAKGGAPLHFAAHFGRRDVVEYLLGAGADPDLVDPNTGQTPLQMAEQKRRGAIIKLLGGDDGSDDDEDDYDY
jgi:ankyrin repeat protein